MLLWSEPFKLLGKSVRLEPICMEHLDGLWEAAIPNEIWMYMATKIGSKDDMKKMIDTAIKEREKGTQYTFTVFNNHNIIIGSTRFLDIFPAQKSVEIGWTWYHPDVWRTKVNTECKLLLLTHAFETWNLTRVQLKTDARNLRSQKAIARLGAVKEGTLRKDRIISDGFARDTVYYSILCDEWGMVKNGLIMKLEE
ncbi:GNAT family N-acetyltransferase [Neobacillus sp.]|uniref:GNAT family N-acetyltransferase n=1 Tax=Neobacillus sp. TaxID=2675273 RepID=UPI00289FBE43|nr:GNAT family N-acetyltransferase [Neobacillus sp.]